jgi:hypothetical protein
MRLDRNTIKSDYTIFVYHADYEPWASIVRNGPLQTWLGNPIENVYYFSGKSSKALLRGIDEAFWKLKWNKKYGKFAIGIESVIQKFLLYFKPKIRFRTLAGTDMKLIETQIPDLNFLYNHKTMSMLTTSLKLEWEYLVSVTSTSYVSIDSLEDILTSLPKTNCVAGRILQQGINKFPCGTFRVFSRDVVELLVKNRRSYCYYLAEDLALGRLISELGIAQLDIPSVDLPDLESLQKYEDSELMKIPHFRCKSGTHQDRKDVAIIPELQGRLNK